MVDPMNVTCVINQYTAKCGLVSYTNDTTVYLYATIGFAVAVVAIIFLLLHQNQRMKTILYETGNDKAVADLEKATKVWRVIPGKKGND